MSAVYRYFETITQIPHCSREAQQLKDFLVGFAKERGYEVLVDEAENILIFKGKPKLCLQAHYDMVCMGKAPIIESYVEEGVMRAKDASLGADNGMAIAMMMQLMDEGEILEFLLTADEEVGLIGANALAFELQSDFMLNLDSEDEAEVYIGCAGGIDMVASFEDSVVEGVGECYEVAVKSLVGGHSGVDIDKGIPSAIKVLGEYLYAQNVTQLVSFYGGERRNSIPANAVAVVYSEHLLEETSMVNVRLLSETPKVLKEGQKAIALLATFQQGVRVEKKALGIPDVSINLAMVSMDERGKSTIELSARAMDSEGLEHIKEETASTFSLYGFDIVFEDKYPSWKPEVTPFTHVVVEKMEEVYGQSALKAIHAGLECGVIAEKYPHMKFASIGPTIRYPHSTREEVDLASVERTFNVLTRIVAYYKI
jgi:dipeptidase D